jgi:hypothetical protein
MIVPSFRPVSSTWDMNIPRVREDILGGRRKNLTRYVKLKKKKMMNTDSSGPDLGLATGDPFVRTFD